MTEISFFGGKCYFMEKYLEYYIKKYSFLLENSVFELSKVCTCKTLCLKLVCFFLFNLNIYYSTIIILVSCLQQYLYKLSGLCTHSKTTQDY